MNYYFNITLTEEFDKAVTRVTEVLKDQGFGILTEIDVGETLKQKLGVDFRRYKILGACNPPYAHQALEAEDKIGTMLPCNVIVQEKGDSTVEIAAINPLASMQAIENEDLDRIAAEITQKLKKVIDAMH